MAITRTYVQTGCELPLRILHLFTLWALYLVGSQPAPQRPAQLFHELFCGCGVPQNATGLSVQLAQSTHALPAL